MQWIMKFKRVQEFPVSWEGQGKERDNDIDCKQSLFFLLSSLRCGKTSLTPARGKVFSSDRS